MDAEENIKNLKEKNQELQSGLNLLVEEKILLEREIVRKTESLEICEQLLAENIKKLKILQLNFDEKGNNQDQMQEIVQSQQQQLKKLVDSNDLYKNLHENDKETIESLKDAEKISKKMIEELVIKVDTLEDTKEKLLHEKKSFHESIFELQENKKIEKKNFELLLNEKDKAYDEIKEKIENYKEIIETLEEKVKNLTFKNKESEDCFNDIENSLKEEILSLQSEITEKNMLYESEMGKLSEENETFTQIIHENMCYIEKSSERLLEKEEKIRNLEKRLTEIENIKDKELENHKTKLESLENYSNEILTTLKQKNNEFTDNEADFNTKNSKIVHLQQEITDLKLFLNEKILYFNSSSSLKDSEIASLTLSLQASAETSNKQSQMISNLKQALMDSNSEIENFERKIKTQENEINLLKKDQKSLFKTSEKEKIIIKENEKTIHDLKEKVKILEEKVEDYEIFKLEEIEKHDAEIFEKENMIVYKENQIKIIESEIKSFKKKFFDSETVFDDKIKELERKFQKLIDKHEFLAEKNEKLEVEKIELLSKIEKNEDSVCSNTKENEINEYKKNVFDLTQDNKNLLKTIENLSLDLSLAQDEVKDYKDQLFQISKKLIEKEEKLIISEKIIENCQLLDINEMREKTISTETKLILLNFEYEKAQKEIKRLQELSLERLNTHKLNALGKNLQYKEEIIKDLIEKNESLKEEIKQFSEKKTEFELLLNQLSEEENILAILANISLETEEGLTKLKEIKAKAASHIEKVQNMRFDLIKF